MHETWPSLLSRMHLHPVMRPETKLGHWKAIVGAPTAKGSNATAHCTKDAMAGVCLQLCGMFITCRGSSLTVSGYSLAQPVA